MDGDEYYDHDRWTQNAANSLFGSTNPYANHTHQPNGYYGQPSAGGFNNYGQSSGYPQQPPPSYDYAPDPQYSYGYSHQPISHGNFGRSYSDFHTYNHNQPPPGNYGRSQSDVHVHHQPTSYSNDSDEEAHRPAAGSKANEIATLRKDCEDICVGEKQRKCKRSVKLQQGTSSIQCRCEWQKNQKKGGECIAVVG
ncbi:hypothetical protein niasHT_003007 [Heterodera trifolii]|uniref:Uncharacterized protein n=1 Tax=Heterodera trifolii TaxID=157864 RepID=A0ABD2MEZ1_9BILA